MEVERAVGSSERTLALAQGPPAPPPEPSPPPPPPPPPPPEPPPPRWCELLLHAYCVLADVVTSCCEGHSQEVGLTQAIVRRDGCFFSIGRGARESTKVGCGRNLMADQFTSVCLHAVQRDSHASFSLTSHTCAICDVPRDRSWCRCAAARAQDAAWQATQAKSSRRASKCTTMGCLCAAFGRLRELAVVCEVSAACGAAQGAYGRAQA